MNVDHINFIILLIGGPVPYNYKNRNYNHGGEFINKPLFLNLAFVGTINVKANHKYTRV
jgi:hypothetical protein